MKKIIFNILFSITAINTFAQVAIPPDSTFYYLPNGQKSWWYVQKDMASFRLNSGAAYIGAKPAYVDSIQHLSTTSRKQNLLKFKNTATIIQKATFINGISTMSNYEWFTPVVSQKKGLNYTSNKWVNTSDLILIKFRNPNLISAIDIVNFASRNNLTLDYQPPSSLPNANAWTFIFKINKLSNAKPYGDVFSVCQQIFISENGYVTHCEPGMYLYKQDACVLPNEFSAWATTSTPNALWHIQNNGGNVGTGSGTAGADAKICECWGEGFHGENIKVAIIDGDAYDYSLPDMLGQYLQGYDFINNVSFNNTYALSNNPHGMKVASVIASIENGGQTVLQPINATNVGVAYKSKIIPYIVDFTNISVAKAVQRAVVDGADVVNMSFGYDDNSLSTKNSAMYSDILLAVQNGRSGKGIVFVASSGNDNLDVKHWPASDKYVIGTGASDPNDYRGASTNSQAFTWVATSGLAGSNFVTPNVADTIRYDVVAPGTEMRVNFTDNPFTAPNYYSTSATGTSFSSPLVAGVAAILLSKYPNMTFKDVINTINSNADKIRPTTYNYNQFSSFLPNYSKETFYGRVNCINTILNPVVGIKENIKLSDEIKLAYLNANEAIILFNQNTNSNKGFYLSIYDMAGRLIDTKQITPNITTYTFNIESLTKGVYLFQLNAIQENSSKSFKYIK